jgi:diacylglycerol kinase (CTP)
VRLCTAPSAPLEQIVLSTTFPSVNISRASRKDKHLHSPICVLRVADIRRFVVGVIRYPSLPPFDYTMSQYQIPATPRVISPSPTPSESQEGSQDGYFGPVTRSSAKKRVTAPAKIDEGVDDEESDPNTELRRARSKSREPLRVRKMSGLSEAKPSATVSSSKSLQVTANGGATNGHLSPSSAAKTGWSWRDLSRSPSPLGLIPIHRQWRSFVHRHEVPRKLLHVSIGFFTIWAYVSGMQTSQITPYLIGALVPVATADYLRFTFPSFNRVYVRVLGALMRETEYDAWNGVIWYMLGVWIILSFFPKDVGVVGVLLLSWCDTAASTIGRAYGRYTPRIRKGKSLAGSLAAFLVGIVTAISFWGWLAPYPGQSAIDKGGPFMFTGTLRLPSIIQDSLGLTEAQSSITGGPALAVMSLWTGFVASASEVADIFGWDDNLTIPVLSGIGMWAFLKVFG